MIAEESVVGLCNLLFNVYMLSLCITLFHNKDGTRLTVKSIVVDIGTVVTVRDLCLHDTHGEDSVTRLALDHALSRNLLVMVALKFFYKYFVVTGISWKWTYIAAKGLPDLGHHR